MLSKIISQHLATQVGFDPNSAEVRSVSGGDINEAYYINTTKGKFFIKLNSASRFPNMFEQEAHGLHALRNAKAITIPEVLCFGEENDTSFLVLEWIECTSPSNHFWQVFGEQLAQLHKISDVSFGLDQNNYIGSLHQSNKMHPTWEDFFIYERLMPQVKLAVDAGRMDETTQKSFDNFYRELPNIFPTEAPALLHGDLWSGNFMVGNNGEPVIMDPAVYFGHREMDLAMTKLFGGYDTRLYQTYHEHYPLEKNWEARVQWCNLYPLLVHVNLFGGGYAQQVKSIVDQF